jgi:hypothetical protein
MVSRVGRECFAATVCGQMNRFGELSMVAESVGNRAMGSERDTRLGNDMVLDIQWKG